MRQLMPFQRSAVEFCKSVPHPALFLEMRLGKTIVTIHAIKEQFHGVRTMILVIAPYSAFEGWQQELKEAGIPDKWVWPLPSGSQAKREILLTLLERQSKLPDHIYVLCNHEGYKGIETLLPFIFWDVVVFDESTRIKDPTTQMSQFYTENFRGVSKRFILAGMPTPEDDTDLHNQMLFLDPKIIGMSWYKFRSKFFNMVGERRWWINPEGKLFLKERVGRFCRVVKRDEVNMGSRKVRIRRMVDLPVKARKIYDTLQEEFLVEANGKVIDSTMFAPVKFQWMRRILGGLYDNKLVHTAKIDELLYLLRGELKNIKVVVWANFNDEINYICKTLRNSGIACKTLTGATSLRDRDEVIRSFRVYLDSNVLVIQPKCCRFGLDLSCCDTAIYYSTPIEAEVRAQTEDRLVNVTKGGTVAIIDLLCRKTIDVDIYELMQEKDYNQDMMKKLLNRMGA